MNSRNILLNWKVEMA